jgi:hypothetical protein
MKFQDGFKIHTNGTQIRRKSFTHVADGAAVYTVIVWCDDTVSCNCKAWKSKAYTQNSTCVHTQNINSATAQNTRVPGVPVPIDIDEIRHHEQRRNRKPRISGPTPPRLRLLKNIEFDEECP